jgi:hypothetical protein
MITKEQQQQERVAAVRQRRADSSVRQQCSYSVQQLMVPAMQMCSSCWAS